VPEHFLVEVSRRGVVIKPANLGTNDAFEGLKHRTIPNSVHWTRPLRPLAQVHRIVISVGEPESNRDPSGSLKAQRIDQLFAEEAHGRRAQNDDSLLVQSDNPLIGPKVEQFCEVQVPALRRVVAT
jgi:hypothetical protein